RVAPANDIRCALTRSDRSASRHQIDLHTLVERDATNIYASRDLRAGRFGRRRLATPLQARLVVCAFNSARAAMIPTRVLVDAGPVARIEPVGAATHARLTDCGVLAQNTAGAAIEG